MADIHSTAARGNYLGNGAQRPTHQNKGCTLFTAVPRGIYWQLKIVEDGKATYKGCHRSRREAEVEAEALAVQRGGEFLR
jgi:hypothetical protein